MNPWTRSEIHEAATLLDGPVDWEQINRIYDQLGPLPGLCLIDPSRPTTTEYYEDDLQWALSDIKLDEITELLKHTNYLRIDKISHHLCLIVRKKRSDVAGPFTVKPITEFIALKLACRLESLRQAKQLELYRMQFSTGSRGISSVASEAYGQSRIREGLTLEIVRMVRVPDPPRPESAHGMKKRKLTNASSDLGGRMQSLWRSSHLPMNHEVLHMMRTQALLEKVDFGASVRDGGI